MAWLPETFVHPSHVRLDDAHHLRPIRASDVDIDYTAVMGSRERLWSLYGDAWGWPPASMTREQNHADLARHEQEQHEQVSFNYVLLDTQEKIVFGCVYIDPDDEPATDAVISWWVVDDQVGTRLEQALNEFVPRWIAQRWPFVPRYGI